VVARARAVASSASAREAERCDAGEAAEGGGQASPAARARSAAGAACEGAEEAESEERVSAAHPMAPVASCSTSAPAMRARGAARRWRAPGLRLHETHVAARQQQGACLAGSAQSQPDSDGAPPERSREGSRGAGVAQRPGAFRAMSEHRALRTGCRARARTSRRKH
jgi:hypothetical protein